MFGDEEPTRDASHGMNIENQVNVVVSIPGRKNRITDRDIRRHKSNDRPKGLALKD